MQSTNKLMIVRQEKRVLRLKLTDIVATDIQDDVMYFLQSIRKNIDFKLEIRCWYPDKSISTSQLDSFLSRNRTLIETLNLRTSCLNGHEEFVWYDIIPKTDEDLLTKFKFRIIYNTPDEFLTGLVEFNGFAKSYNTGNTNNEKSSSYRFPKMARPNSH